MQRVVLEMAAASVPDPAAILDVGCGTGRLLRKAREGFPAAQLDGVDAAPEMVQQAKLSAGGEARINFQTATAEDLPFPAAKFDLVFSTMTFHHWADQAKGITEVKRVLTARGRWILADFMPSGVPAFLTWSLSAGHMPERGRLNAMLAAHGLRLEARRSVWRTMGNISVVAIAAN